MTEPGSIKQISSFIIFEVAQKAKPTSLNSNLSASQPTSWAVGEAGAPIRSRIWDLVPNGTKVLKRSQNVWLEVVWDIYLHQVFNQTFSPNVYQYIV